MISPEHVQNCIRDCKECKLHCLQMKEHFHHHQKCIQNCELCISVCESLLVMILLNTQKHFNKGFELMKAVCMECKNECEKHQSMPTCLKCAISCEECVKSIEEYKKAIIAPTKKRKSKKNSAT